jgi:hypothetical protein
MTENKFFESKRVAMEGKMTKTFTRAVGLLVSISAIASPAMGQSFSWPSNNPVLDNLAYGQQINDIVRSRQSNQVYRPVTPTPRPQPITRGKGQAQGQIQTVRPSAAALTFAISRPRRQTNINVFVDNIAQANPGAGNLLRQAFQQEDFFGAVETRIAPTYAMAMNNVADSAALWLAAAWFAANDDDRDLTRAQFQGLKAQIASSYLQNTRLVALDSGSKQDMSDNLLLMAVWIDVSAQAYKSNQSRKAAYRSSIIAMAQRDTGIDLTTFALTDTGLVPK